MRMGDGLQAEENLQITVPSVTKKSLKIAAAESGESMRMIVLKALSASGITVPGDVLQDRRRSK